MCTAVPGEATNGRYLSMTRLKLRRVFGHSFVRIFAVFAIQTGNLSVICVNTTMHFLERPVFCFNAYIMQRICERGPSTFDRQVPLTLAISNTLQRLLRGKMCRKTRRQCTDQPLYCEACENFSPEGTPESRGVGKMLPNPKTSVFFF